ncbi:DUF6931 family protein [Providencia rettgeri]|uniref:DUF6931 family protein n=1 Tax=Providencia rettgeri TaxID=587 RepID=UPI001419E3C5|nr:hypothetical protein [Providencia rettgeri]NIH07160.1 hypothetical protein [Providencia rettgeri]
MKQNESSTQQLLELDQWEKTLQQWFYSLSPQVLGPQLAILLQKITPIANHQLLNDISSAYHEKNDSLRWSIFEKAQLIGFGTPTGSLALALFWSYGSMSPLGFEPVYPDPKLSSQMLYCVVLMVVTQLADSPINGLTQFLSLYTTIKGT